ncbi:unnamed protein product [Hermetia illucens]|uniref:Uncharacterized protein n=1 Tax=Hermetia illucens TaxID=343691 RepID=A0A7R8YQ06_HERIL|nr:unnamed protein product [Hermetia illucens]
MAVTRRNIDNSTTKRTIPQGRRSRRRNKKGQQNSGRIDSEMQRANNARKSSSCLASNSSKHAGPRVTRSTLNTNEDPKVGYGAAHPDTQRAGAPNQIRKDDEQRRVFYETSNDNTSQLLKIPDSSHTNTFACSKRRRRRNRIRSRRNGKFVCRKDDHGQSRKTANINAEHCLPSKIHLDEHRVVFYETSNDNTSQLFKIPDSPDTNTSARSKRARRRRRNRIRSRRNRKFVCHDCKAASPWLKCETIWTDEFADGRRPRENGPYAAQPIATRYSEDKYSEDQRVPSLDTDCGDSDLQVVPDIDSARTEFGGPMEGWALLGDDSDMFSGAADGQAKKLGWRHWY